MSIKKETLFGSALVSSETMQWKIPDFFATMENSKYKSWINSPPISSSGCLWTMSVCEGPGFIKEKLLIRLECSNKKTAAKKAVTIYVASERADFRVEMVSLYPPSEINSWVFMSAFNLDELKRRKSQLVPSDTLTMTFHVESIDSDQPMDFQRLMGLENLSSSFEELFDSKKKTDATIIVKDKDFAVHKLVLMARSSVFSGMFGHDTTEEKTGVVKVPDCDPDSFQDFLRYLYTGKFDVVTPSNAHHLYVTADKYDVQPLKSFCVDHMKQNLAVGNVLDVIVLADRYEESELLSAAQDFFSHYFGKVLSTSRWRSLFKEDFEFTNRLLLQMESKLKCVIQCYSDEYE